jgi:hypothetical protein
MIHKVMPTWFHIILLLLTCIPYGLSGPISESSKPVAKPVGCLPWADIWHEVIYFQTDNDPEIEFAIRTSYTEYYPKALESALRLSGFDIQWGSKCGWNKTSSVKVKSWLEVGHHRGDIYWKYRDLHWISSKNATEPSHWIAESPTHIPPRTGVQPHAKTLEEIRHILEHNEPVADVYIKVTTVLAWLTGILGFLCIMIFLICRIENNARSKNLKNSNDIELQKIKGKLGPKPASIPKPTERVALPRGQVSHVLETGTSGQSTPPPQYSAENPRRHGNDSSSASARLKERYGVAAGRNDRIGD